MADRDVELDTQYVEFGVTAQLILLLFCNFFSIFFKGH